MHVGYKLKKLRENKRVSQQEVADFLEISQRTYSNFESDKSKPSIDQLSKLSELLDFDLLELLQEQGITFNQKNKNGSNNAIVKNEYPEQLVTQYEFRISELKELITLLKDKITSLEQ